MTKTAIQSPTRLSQPGRLRFLLRDSTLYGGAAAISKAFSLITFPLLARHFTVTDYGIFDYFSVLIGLLALLFIFGQDSAVARYFYEYEDADERKQLISQSLIFQLAVLAVFLPLLWLNASWLTGLMIDASDRVLLFKLALLQLPFLLLINFSQNLLKWTFERSRFLTLSLGSTVLNASLLSISILVFDYGIPGVLTASLLVYIVFSALGLFFVRKWLVLPKGFRRLLEMLPFAIPCGAISVASAFSPTLERTLTNHLLGIEPLGLYAAATKIAMLIGLLVSAFQTAWGPFALSLYKQTDAGQTYNQVLRLFTISMCLAVLFITLLAQPLIHILASNNYNGAVVVVFPLVMGLAIQAISWITEIGISLSKRSYLNLYAYLAAIIMTLTGIWFLTPVFGLLGVGLGVLLGLIIKALMASWLAQRAYPLPWCYKSAILLISLTLVIGLLSIWIGKTIGIAASNLLLGTSIIFILSVNWQQYSSVFIKKNSQQS